MSPVPNIDLIIENIIRELKIFRILAEKYRNRRRRFLLRFNLIAAGPIITMAAKSIPEFGMFEKIWNERSPLKWDFADPIPAAQGAIALLSDWFPKTSGEIIHVDGGLHAIGG